jgi:hypothetical protein
MTVNDKIKVQLVNRGFVELSRNKTPKTLRWRPDLIFSKDGYIYLILIKSNNSVPPTFLNRIASIPKGNIIPLIIFSQRPARDERFILSLGISIGYYSKGKLSELILKKKLSQKIIQKEIKKLEVIDIFVSSKQDIPERKFIEERIEYLRKANSYPFSPPRLIEYHRYSLKNKYTYINKVMDMCEWVIIILEENHSKDVSYEINRAVRTKNHDNIFMYVKYNNTCQTAWKKELNKIKKLESKSIKYSPYSNQSELEVELSNHIKTRMIEICKKKKVNLFMP